MASARVIPDTVAKAVDALLKWRRSQSEAKKPKLFDEDEEFVYLIVTLKKIPQNARVNPHKIPLPHSLLSQFSEQCLILDDRPNKARVTKAQAQSKIQLESIPVSKVLKLSKLASDYRPFEAKRKLCDSYDLFFAEKSIVPMLPRLLGKHFFKKRKIPVPLDLKKKNWKEQVERACSSAMLFVRTGTCSVVRVAKLRMERDEIVENVVAAIEGVAEVVPKKWENVRSFHVKLLESLALPIYQAVPDVRLKIEGVKVEDDEEMPKKKRKKDGEVHDPNEGGKKKGRIHEVRYMDENVSEAVDNDELGGVDGDDDGSDDEKVDMKREKGVSGVLSGVKRSKKLSAKGSAKEKKRKALSAPKAVKEGLVGESGSKLSVMDEELGVKKKMMKRGDVKVKAKKSKKAA
ncbi:ribosomal L1 domain-containing protein 1-like [Abrus precatorius]|uniref:Ribosomal L1 domain-containing protein 1-like n=1 Tax=Abrus precatorius TaxID=3816 RepID=A0A8B8KFD7_ABRPR|nr:ribosomal L1 domain-containing protein 1-like [Abrus precatorius]